MWTIFFLDKFVANFLKNLVVANLTTYCEEWAILRSSVSSNMNNMKNRLLEKLPIDRIRRVVILGVLSSNQSNSENYMQAIWSWDMRICPAFKLWTSRGRGEYELICSKVCMEVMERKQNQAEASEKIRKPKDRKS